VELQLLRVSRPAVSRDEVLEMLNARAMEFGLVDVVAVSTDDEPFPP